MISAGSSERESRKNSMHLEGFSVPEQSSLTMSVALVMEFSCILRSNLVENIVGNEGNDASGEGDGAVVGEEEASSMAMEGSAVDVGEDELVVVRSLETLPEGGEKSASSEGDMAGLPSAEDDDDKDGEADESSVEEEEGEGAMSWDMEMERR
ncbi:unnamed protein product, partial [Linum tenue]